ncbi:C6 transcription factor, putative [Talaromyces stipitatus ATCC 10500]|uniref:C6 transcription factor, putative n=1 Tax=Talaromyces stipitatus (strain ATCC 10500 / CBS 375.48 / QM 6759 / NRRL 1006) TaxID=441959 RepID=B8MK43_TALSN|nr:C6 transcription factor, putative [Talaromyces stipitatus ATCC 10500]XP_002484814.1 C6 transcription factor, putative [Talaromyces stipitatus ATCC 10500]EED14860.1 C6 transcription factor, putative [Talaromyces stipitatus ATCC 10500]EED14861.1 C6 transcription factor, putative [Talaromyces stipitatus ATCC 10500]
MPSPSKQCHSCRRSRLRCDGGQPTCLNCDSRGVECLGYGSQPFLWVRPRSSVSASAKSNYESSIISPAIKKKGRPRLVLMQRSEGIERDRGSNCQLDLMDKQTESSSVEVVPALSSLLPAGYADALSTLEVLVYFRSQPYYVLAACVSAVSSSTDDAIDFTARCLNKFTHPLVKTIYKHHHQVIKGLGMLVDDEDLRFSDITFGLIADLMLFGCRYIKLLTTTRSALGSRVVSQLHYIEYLPQIHRNGLDAGFPSQMHFLKPSYAPTFLDLTLNAFQTKFGLTLVLDRDSSSPWVKDFQWTFSSCNPRQVIHSWYTYANCSLLMYFSVSRRFGNSYPGHFSSPEWSAPTRIRILWMMGESFAESLCRVSYIQGDISMLDVVSSLQCIWKMNSGMIVNIIDYVSNNKLMCYNRRADGGTFSRCRDVMGRESSNARIACAVHI